MHEKSRSHSALRTVALLALVSITLCGPALAKETHTDERDKLRELARIYEQAISKDELDLLMPHLHTGFTGAMVTGEYVEGADELRAYWEKINELIGDGGRYRVEVEPRDATLIFEEGVAITQGTTRDFVRTGDGDEYRFSTEWTAVLQTNDAGAWKLRHLQATMDPLTNPFVSRARTAYGWITGLIGLGGGLIAGGLGGWLFRRRRVNG